MTLMQLKGDRAHWSYSSLNGILGVCSLQWAFERYWQVPPSGKVPGALTFGSAYHRAQEYWATARQEGRQIQENDLRELFDTVFRRQVEEDGDVDFDDGDIESTARQGRDAIACAMAHTDPEERVLAVNSTFCVPLTTADGTTLVKPLIGEADCIVEKAGKRSVVDWKTSGARYSDQKVRTSLQATAMLLGTTRTFGPVDAFAFDVVVKLKKAPVYERYTTTRSEDDFARLAALAAAADRIVAAEAFAPNESGYGCAGCRYKAACRDWHVSKERVVPMAA